jgi:CHASE2 domain-containing sensor protein
MDLKDRAELLSKVIDGLYKKLIVLLAIAGGFGAYAIKFLQNSHWIGYLFAIVFTLVSIAVFITYTKLRAPLKTPA